MSADNSGNGSFGKPFLSGYAVEWDVTTGKWAARSDSSDTVLYGKDQDELDTARWKLVVTLADELSAILRAAPERGYSPPPRYEPPRPADNP